VERKCPLKHPWAWTLFVVLVAGFAVCASRCAMRGCCRRGLHDELEVREPTSA
jgi:hypothetical protein